MIQTGHRNFWIAQGIGWGGFALANLGVQFTAGLSLKLLLINSVFPLIIGILITTIFRFCIRKYNWKKWSLFKMILMIFGSTLLQTTILIAIFFLILNPLLGLGESHISSILSNALIFLIIFWNWNLFYFCIHYANNWHYSEAEKWKLLAEMKDAQLGSLKSQINPHFVFNALNNIRSLIQENPEKARDMLLNFSDLFRYSLKHAETPTVKLKQELEVVQQYLELLSIQFEDKLKYTINVEESLLSLQIPPMILQILIENAVKHGISRYKEGGIINLEIFKRSNFLQIDVKNTGSLKPKTALGEKLGIGLENIKERLQLIYDGQANFNIQELNNFVITTIKIPSI